jgi:hypothetical protein
MIYRVAVLSAVLLAGMGFTIPAYAGISYMQVFNGTCDSISHTAEGPLGTDPTKQGARFFCDSAVVTFFDDSKDHVAVQFAQKESRQSPILGFAGHLGDDGNMMHVDTVYLVPGQATTVNDGSCKFFYSYLQLSGIVCSMNLKEPGQRTRAIVSFGVTHSQTQATLPQTPTADAAPVDPQAKAFTDCIISKAKNGEYSSLDGGKSATRLLGECPDQWKEYVDACMRSGDTDGDCTLKSGILAQAALKLLNK